MNDAGSGAAAAPGKDDTRTRLIAMGSSALMEGYALIGFETWPEAGADDVEQVLTDLLGHRHRALIFLEPRLARSGGAMLQKVRQRRRAHRHYRGAAAAVAAGIPPRGGGSGGEPVGRRCPRGASVNEPRPLPTTWKRRCWSARASWPMSTWPTPTVFGTRSSRRKTSACACARSARCWPPRRPQSVYPPAHPGQRAAIA